MGIKLYKKLIKRIYPFVKGNLKKNIIALILNQVVTLLNLVQPILLKILIDDVLEKKDFNGMLLVISAMSIAFLLGNILGYISNYFYAVFCSDVGIKSRESLFENLLDKRLEFFNKKKVGDISSRLNEDACHIHTLISYVINNVFNNIILLIVVFFIMIKMNLILGVISIITVPIFVILNNYFTNKLRKYTKVLREQQTNLLGFFFNCFSKILLVKNFCTEEQEIKKHNKIGVDLRNQMIKTEMTAYTLHVIVSILSNMNRIITLGIGGYMVLQNHLSIGALIAFNSYLKYIYTPILNLTKTITGINKTTVSVERFFEYFDYGCEEFEGDMKNTDYSGNIQFKDIDFSYDDKTIFNGVNLNIQGKEQILLTGKSGIGKSTLSYILKKFYKVSQGEILIDNININHINIKELRYNIGYLTQDPFIIDGNIRDNFKIVDPDVGDDEIFNALEKVGLKEFVNSLENGLEEYIGNNGANISGGQKQRLSIARLFIQNPPIIIFDEIFKGLDMDTEKKIWLYLKEFCSDKTAIFISHRITDMDYFDKIFWVNDKDIRVFEDYREFIENYNYSNEVAIESF
ncbi:ABC transporter ATP-binding protein [Oceanirhabdus sp. W0125-5]|uniref:ABC transporter ATP-binding protein n=1 Tax=Oceanirhabdus sp. W0125-5 TaxID=2999116 RepID=UPI0022F33453|nr:ABC transporter ATP-binding protein [Oceanirhabdus sp. W0125-5]WBW96423.1 ABC transporter ATP-binding protein [Oceanirhabdus sp. W0125-5]